MAAELGSSRSAAHRRCVVAVGVEWRVQINDVNRHGVEAAQDVQVVPGPDGSVNEVAHFMNTVRQV